MTSRTEFRPTQHAFTLVELLAVVAIVVVLTSFVGPALKLGNNLASTGNRIAGLVEQARQRSMSKNVLTALVLNTDSATGADYQAFTLLEYNAEEAAPQWKQVAPWEKLPTGVVVDGTPASTFLDYTPQPLPFAASPQLPVKYQGRVVADYAARVFLPSGALNNPGVPAQIQLVEGSRTGGRIVYVRPAAGGGAANWYRISIIGATGRGKIERP